MPPGYEWRSAGIIEAVDVLEYGRFCLSPGWPVPPPDHFCLQGFDPKGDEANNVSTAELS